MFDFGDKWTAAEPFESRALEIGDLTIAIRTAIPTHLVSGNLAAGLAAFGLTRKTLGANDVAGSGSHALAIARDRCLVVSGDPRSAPDGWLEGGYFVTTMTGGLIAVEIGGAGLGRCFAEATTLDFSQAMRSAAIVFAGITVYASWADDRRTFRLFIEAPMLPFLCIWLGKVAKADAL
jgi:hypothetical protein